MSRDLEANKVLFEADEGVRTLPSRGGVDHPHARWEESREVRRGTVGWECAALSDYT